jgi:hypothetical protein
MPSDLTTRAPRRTSPRTPRFRNQPSDPPAAPIYDANEDVLTPQDPGTIDLTSAMALGQTAPMRQAVPPVPYVRPVAPRPAAQAQPQRVRATRMGYYDHARRREGDVFTIASPREFSAKWMEPVHAATPERLTSMPQAMRQQHDEILGGTMAERLVGDEDVLGE